MTRCAERNQIGFRIIASLAAKLLMMEFQIRHRAAQLTAPSIPTQHLLSQILVGDTSSPNRPALERIQFTIPSPDVLEEGLLRFAVFHDCETADN
jgi:hypothetical protein